MIENTQENTAYYYNYVKADVLVKLGRLGEGLVTLYNIIERMSFPILNILGRMFWLKQRN